MKKNRLFTGIFTLVCILTMVMGSTAVKAEDQQANLLDNTNTVTVNAELVGQIGGETYAVAWQGNYAYIGVGPRLVILDVSDPAVPVFIGQTSALPDLVKGVVVAGNYAYVVDGTKGLRIIDMYAPTTPTEIGFYDTPGDAEGLTVVGNYAYVASGGSGLRIIDISNPVSPSEVGFYNTPDYSFSAQVAGSYAYVADGSSGLRIINISNPATPTEIGFYDTPGNASDVKVAGNYAYVAERMEGLCIIDITDPTMPTEVGVYNTSSIAYGVAVAGNYAYVADFGKGLRIIDVSNPAVPVEVGFYDTPNGAVGVTLAMNYAYVADSAGGLRIIDVSNLATPIEAGYYKGFPSNAFGVTVAGTYAYVGDISNGLRIIDISNPATPTEAASYDTPGSANGVTVVGSYAYVGDGPNGGLRIIDITNPLNPIEAGFYDTPGSASEVAVAGNYAYVADGGSGLRIIDITNPAIPTQTGFYDTADWAYDVKVAGNYAYVADGSGGLRIVNISNPAAPTQIGHYTTPDGAKGLTVAGNYAYVAADMSGLRIVDISNPAAPIEVGFYDTIDLAEDVAVLEHYAYVANQLSGLRIIDISNPAAPVEVGFYNTLGTSVGISILGSYAYVADWQGGLDILHITINESPVAMDDSGEGFSTDEDTPFLTADVLANDLDPDGDPLAVDSFDASRTLGEVSYSVGGTFNYDPNSQFEWLGEGEQAFDTFTYVASDGALTDSATVTITVNGVNDAPMAEAGDNQEADEGQAITFAGSFIDPDWQGGLFEWDFGDGFTATGALTPTHTYFDNGVYTVTLTVTDNAGAAGSDWLLVTVNNVAPWMGELPDRSVMAGTPFTLTATFSDPGLLDTHQVVIEWAPGFTQTLDFAAGVYEFSTSYTYLLGDYQVAVILRDDDGGEISRSFTVNVMAAPIAMDDSGAGFITYEDTSFLTADVLANDVDPNGDPLVVDSFDASGLVGEISYAGGGQFNYDPSGQFEWLGTDEQAFDVFTYVVSDGILTDTATVTLTVNGINDSPVAMDDSGAGFTTDEDNPLLTGDVLSNDLDPDGDPLLVERFDASGLVGEISYGGGGQFSYDPNEQFEWLGAGEQAFDVFTYVASDGVLTDTATVTITINGINDSPVAMDDSGTGFITDEDTPFLTADVLANDFDPDGDPLVVESFNDSGLLGEISYSGEGTFTYDPNGQFEWLGEDEQAFDIFTYIASDGILTDTAIVTITINGINDSPVAMDDSGVGFITDEDMPFLTADVLSNDFDPDGDPLSVESFDDSGLLGGISYSGGGTFNYDPNGQFEWLGSGEQAFDTFTYVASDGVLTDTATVSITVNGVNDAPLVEAGENQEADEGQLITFAGGFTDPDWQGGTIEWDFGDGFTATGTLTPTHTYFDNGVYTVTLTVTDDEGASGSDWLLATINNVAPWMDVLPDMSVKAGAPLTLTATFSDPGLLDTHQVVIEWAPGYTQTLDLPAEVNDFNASYTYAEAGEYLVTVTMSDDDGGVISRTFTVTVLPASVQIFIPMISRQ